MKKLLLTLVATIAMASNASAVSLKEAFSTLSNLPNVSIVQPDYNLPVTSEILQNPHIAAAYNLNQEQIGEAGSATFTILNMVPLNNLVNGGANSWVGGFVYATDNNDGTYDILIVSMSGYRGAVVYIYAQTDAKIIDAIRNAKLEIHESYLRMDAGEIPGVGEFNIIG